MTPDGDVTELQARAIVAASDVFGRVAAEFAAATPTAEDGGAAGADPIGEQELRAASARLVDLFAGLLQEGIEGYLELARSIGQRPVDAATAGAGLTLRGVAGGRAVTTVWIHNTASRPLGPLALRLTGLEGPQGARVDGSCGRFVAPGVVVVAAGASASSILTVDIPPGTPPDTYFGHVLAGGTANAAVALTLVVAPAGG